MPAYTVYITPAADMDLITTIEYYNLKAEGLGYRFAELVEEYVNRIALNPTASSVRYLDVRCKAMTTFPYLIMHTIDESRKAVQILLFFHEKQNPLW